MTDKELIKQEIERRINISLAQGYTYSAAQLKRIFDFIGSLPEESGCEANFTTKSEDLDFLVISLEETIGTSPHSREVIKEHLQKAAEWGRNHFEDKSEMVSENLKEEINKWRNHYLSVLDNNLKIDLRDIEVTANHFAEWQKNKMEEALQTEYEKGRFDMREEMMKDAVETVIVNDWQYGKDPDRAIIPAIHQRIEGFNVGDKVKIIICKTEQQ